MSFDVKAVRAEFPIFEQKIHGKPLVYLDSAATTLKPRSVIERMNQHYREETANVHRGVHYLSEKATLAYESVRPKVRSFINAYDDSEIIFTSGTTAGLNILASCLARGRMIGPGDEVLISAMEHHANIVPWQIIAKDCGIVLKVVPINERGELDMKAFYELLTPAVKVVSIVHTSNALGTVNPLAEILRSAKAKGILTIVDAAQAVAHGSIDVQNLDCDFLVFSAHKLFGPTGTGVLWGRKKLLQTLPPAWGGGDMIRSVTFNETTFADAPARFEPGTPNIAGVIGLGAALDFVKNLDLKSMQKYENSLRDLAEDALLKIPGLRLIGMAAEKIALHSFVLENVHPHDIGSIADQDGVALRTGHHCCQPVMDFFGVPATARASFSIYNQESDIATLSAALRKAQELFQ